MLSDCNFLVVFKLLMFRCNHMNVLLIWFYNHLLQILVQHIKAILPGLKSRISSALVLAAKEHASYGEITESKVYFIAKNYLL